jgi:hypothetical protein
MRTIIDGTTDMRESPDWRHECFIAVRHKAGLVATEMIISAFRLNFVNVSPNPLIRCQCGIGATRSRWRRSWRR